MLKNPITFRSTPSLESHACIGSFPVKYNGNPDENPSISSVAILRLANTSKSEFFDFTIAIPNATD